MEQSKVYEEGYQDGLKCGKLCAAQQILDEFEIILTEAQFYSIAQRDENNPEEDGFTYFTGKGAAFSELLRRLPELKNKYEVD